MNFRLNRMPSPQAIFQLSVACCSVAAAIGLCVIAYLDRAYAEDFLAFGGYYLVAASFLVWLSFGWLYLQHQNFDLKEWWSKYRIGVVVSAVVATSIFMAIKPGYRVLSDETNLIAVARSMAIDKNVYNTTMTTWGFEAYQDIENLLPTRPLLYPFLISIWHNLAGYNYHNGFYTNGLLSFAFLALIYIWLSPALGSTAALSILFLAASQPVFGLAATSAGFEMLNLLGFAGLFYLFYRYVNSPTPPLLVLIWYSGILYAHVRYENPLFVALLFLCLLPWLRWHDLKTHYHHLGAGLVLLTPRFWQALTSIGQMENGSQALLSPSRIPERLVNYVYGLCDTNLRYPYAVVTTILIVVSLIYSGFATSTSTSTSRLRWSVSAKATLFFASLATGIYLLITSSHFLADPLHPSVSRLFMLPTVLLSGLAIPGLIKLPAKYQFVALIAAVTSFTFSQSIAIEKRHTRSLTLIRKTQQIYDFLDREADPRSLIIIDRPGQYTVRPMGAVSPEWANEHSGDLLENLRRGLFSKVFVVQSRNRGTKAIQPMPPKGFVLDPVLTFQEDGVTDVIISTAAAAPSN